MTENYSFLIVPFGLALIAFLSTVVHESGHLIFGWAVWLRFERVAIGPFVIKHKSRRWKLRLRPRLYGGFAYMALDRIGRVRRRLIIRALGCIERSN
jgi:hypothetical protein